MPVVCECQTQILSDEQLKLIITKNGGVFKDAEEILMRISADQIQQIVQQEWCRLNCPALSDGRLCKLKTSPELLNVAIIFIAQELKARDNQKLQAGPDFIQ